MQGRLVNEMNDQWQSDADYQLGGLYLDQGRLKKAEEMHLRALAGYEKAWNAEHISTLDTVNKIWEIYTKIKAR